MDILLGCSLAKSLLKAFICLIILTILISLMSLTVLVPNLAALEALETVVTLAALLLPPVRNCVIQMRSKDIVSVDMISSQK